MTNGDLREAFAKHARVPSRAAAAANLAAGRSITFVRDDTPPGHVVTQHADGRVELTRVDLGGHV